MSVPSTMIHMNSILYVYIYIYIFIYLFIYLFIHSMYECILNKFLVRDSSVGITTTYGLDGPGIESW